MSDSGRYDRSIVEGPLPAAVWKIAWPSMLTNIIGGLQGMVDHILVGLLVGFTANAAIGVNPSTCAVKGPLRLVAVGTPVARRPPLRSARAAFPHTREHRLLVADEVARRRSHFSYRPSQEGAMRPCIGLSLPDLEALDATREVVEDDDDPPAERPFLRQGCWPPRYPEAQPRRNRRQVDVPDLVRVVGTDDGSGRQSSSDRLGGKRCLPEHPPHRRWSQVEPRPAEYLGDLGLAQPRAHHLEPLHDVTDQVRELVDGLLQSQKRVRPLFIDPRHPRRHGGERQEEAIRGLLCRPTASSPHLEDRHALEWSVERSPMRMKPRHPGVFDAKLLPQESELLLQPVNLGPHRGLAIPIVDGPGDQAREGVMAERQDLEDGGLHPPVPAAGQGDLAGHGRLREYDEWGRSRGS